MVIAGDVIMFASVILLTCCSCGTSKHFTQLVRNVRVDTVYLSNMQYDSIYIHKDRYQDRSRDTVYLKDVSLEVKYKLLRDTVKVIQRDSVPLSDNGHRGKRVPTSSHLVRPPNSPHILVSYRSLALHLIHQNQTCIQILIDL